MGLAAQKLQLPPVGVVGAEDRDVSKKQKKKRYTAMIAADKKVRAPSRSLGYFSSSIRFYPKLPVFHLLAMSCRNLEESLNSISHLHFYMIIVSSFCINHEYVFSCFS